MSDIDVVLIHGFWSGQATWNNLARRIRADNELKEIQIHLFDYESPKLSLPLMTTRIPDYTDIAQSLDAYLSAHTSRTATVIITHSQGGLILQRFLAWMLNEGRGRELAHIKQIIMLACPNNGSDYLRSIRAMARFGRHPQARDLETLNADVVDVQRVVLRQIVNASALTERTCPIAVYVYSGRTDRVVRRASGQSAFPIAGTLVGSHFTIHDPDKPGDLTFPRIKNHLLEVAGQLREPSKSQIAANRASNSTAPAATKPAMSRVQHNTATGSGVLFAVQEGNLNIYEGGHGDVPSTRPDSGAAQGQ
jgi:hypothetical protein